MSGLETDVELGGRYRLLRKIATGGMGSVWEADDSVLHRRVAVKVISDALAQDPRFVERFRREARAAAGLSHPNVAGVFDYGEDGDTQYMVMELIPGETLAERVARGRMEPSEATRIAEGIAAALQAAHDAGIVHRDVKPGNVMLTPDGSIRVMDFGIAATSWASPLTATGTAIGTATYISPEQAAGERTTPASDVYSLGVVLYEMLAGRPPFVRDSAVAIATAHVRELPPPLAPLAPNAPSYVVAACERALAKEPGDRLPSAAAFAAMLRDPAPLPAAQGTQGSTLPNEVLQGSTEVLAPPTGTAVLPAVTTSTPEAPPRRGGSRRKGVAPLILVLVVLLIAAIAIAVAAGRGKPAPAPSSSPSATATTPAATVKVPDVVNLHLPDAQKALQAEGLTWVVKTVEGQPENIVFDQSPSGGTLVAPNSSVTLFVGAKPPHPKPTKTHHGKGP
jgi:eukaryotic-like serine/threonine-protein kinase